MENKEVNGLKIPNKYLHKYVVGIDFGHGETSAAWCEIEWDKEAGKNERRYVDLELDKYSRAKVLTSAVCQVNDKLHIGDGAFEHMVDNQGIRVCFKQKPIAIEGKEEVLMIEYMKAVYARIRTDYLDFLTDSNHVVYIARPSGWKEENVEKVYKQMALKAGIPLAGLTAESRAALFYANQPAVGFDKIISKGALVFDLGSSTLDFTFISEDDEPIDDGVNLGASIIDEAIYEYMIASNGIVKDFLSEFPVYEGALRYSARKFKEEVYSRYGYSTTESFQIGKITGWTAVTSKYDNEVIMLRVNNVEELNLLVEQTTHYQNRIKIALRDFIINKIQRKKIYGIFLTGGASCMNFIKPLISEVLGIPESMIRVDRDNPSLTISRGIALLGSADAVTHVLVEEIKNKFYGSFGKKEQDELINTLAFNISEASWKRIEDTCNFWIHYGKTTKIDELKNEINKSLRDFRDYQLRLVVQKCIQSEANKQCGKIRNEMNMVIRQYAPDRELRMNGTVQIGDLSDINNAVGNVSVTIEEIINNMMPIIIDVLWKVLGAVLWGVFCIPYYVLKYVFTSDESRRKDKAKRILKKKDEIKSQVALEIERNLQSNYLFKNSLINSLNNHFNSVIDSNLEKVIIPIK